MPQIDKEQRKLYNKQYYQKRKMCEHNREKYRCKECGGNGICEHDRRKSSCKICGGSGICEHNRQKSSCKICGGSQICEHNRQKSQCKECVGNGICKHNKQKSRCKDCGGNGRCQEHNRIKNRCKDCSFKTYLISLQRQSIKRLFKQQPNIKIVNHTVEYLGCDSDFFLKFFQSKMVDGMNFENIHMDHIKPISKFNLEDHDEFLKCCHYSNLQPLLSTDNMNKSSKWTDDDEIFWNENIIYKNYTKLYF